LRVLVTGACGLIGSAVYGRLSQSEAYEVYALDRQRQPSDRAAQGARCAIPDDRFFQADLADWGAIQRAVQGMEAVVHLAADPNSAASWESLRDNNVIGAYHVFEASRLAGVKRVIVASTIQTLYGYQDQEPYRALLEGRYQDVPHDFRPITREQPARPLNVYTSSKVWAEALAHTYAHSHGLSCLIIRIGWVTAEDRPPMRRAHCQWCSQRDIAQLVECCIAAPASLRFDIFFGLSDNLYNIADIDHARQVLGYQPQDRAQDYPM
jgi:nucleoside-diphosphate-sugar epimerase